MIITFIDISTKKNKKKKKKYKKRKEKQKSFSLYQQKFVKSASFLQAAYN